MRSPAASFQTKAIRGHSGRPARGKEWVAARRGRLRVTNDELSLGDLHFPVEEISGAVLWRVRFLLVFRMPMLEFHHGGTPYQFGFNPWAKIAKALPFEFEERMTSMAWSWWSVGYRLVILAIGAVLIGLELAR